MNKLAVFTAIVGFLLVIAGALVTSTGSGLAVPDWPLSYGSLLPPMVGGILYEHSHRLIASGVGLLTLALTLWLLFREPRRWVRRLGRIAFALVVLQGILGGLTVLWQLPAPVSVAHAALGQTFFTVLVLLAVVLSSGWKNSTGQNAHRDARRFLLPLLTVTAIYAQLILGAVLRHTGWRGFLIAAHLLGALVASVLILKLSLSASMVRPARYLPWLLAVQWILGFVTLSARAQVLTATAHVALGALLLATVVVVTLHLFRPHRPFLLSLMRSRTQALSVYLELTKPRLTALAVLTALIGFWLASSGHFDMRAFLAAFMGTILIGGGAAALNQVLEAQSDAQMNRTKKRPIPSGRLTEKRGLAFGVTAAVAGLLVLYFGANTLAGALGALTLISYLFVYTPLKTRSAFCTLWGALPGALPPLIGWAAAQGKLGLEAWLLFAILYLWQLPHFLALAWEFREDYARAEFKMLPVLDPDGGLTFRQAVLYALAMIPVSLVPAALGQAGWLYFSVALVSGLLFLGLGISTAFTRSREKAHRFFLASVLYLPVLLITRTLERFFT